MLGRLKSRPYRPPRESLNEVHSYRESDFPEPRNPCVVVCDLLASMFSMVSKYQNVIVIRSSQEYRRFVKAVSELRGFQLSALNGRERLALYLNLHTLLTLNIYVMRGLPSGKSADRAAFFSNYAYTVGEIGPVSLVDIEFLLLRYNLWKDQSGRVYTRTYLPHLPRSSLPVVASREKEQTQLHWSQDPMRDQRLRRIAACSVPYEDATCLYIFGLSWLVKSSPGVAMFTPPGVHKQLVHHTRNFLTRTVRIDSLRSRVLLPRILDYYHNDLLVDAANEQPRKAGGGISKVLGGLRGLGHKERRTLLMWCLSYMSHVDEVAVQQMYTHSGRSGKAPSVSFADFDWSPADYFSPTLQNSASTTSFGSPRSWLEETKDEFSVGPGQIVAVLSGDEGPDVPRSRSGSEGRNSKHKTTRSTPSSHGSSRRRKVYSRGEFDKVIDLLAERGHAEIGVALAIIREGGPGFTVRDRSRKFKVFRQCFTGRAAASLLCKTMRIPLRHACRLLQHLLDIGAILGETSREATVVGMDDSVLGDVERETALRWRRHMMGSDARTSPIRQSLRPTGSGSNNLEIPGPAGPSRDTSRNTSSRDSSELERGEGVRELSTQSVMWPRDGDSGGSEAGGGGGLQRSSGRPDAGAGGSVSDAEYVLTRRQKKDGILTGGLIALDELGVRVERASGQSRSMFSPSSKTFYRFAASHSELRLLNDVYLRMVAENGLVLRTRRINGLKYRQCFSGAELIDFLQYQRITQRCLEYLNRNDDYLRRYLHSLEGSVFTPVTPHTSDVDGSPDMGTRESPRPLPPSSPPLPVLCALSSVHEDRAGVVAPGVGEGELGGRVMPGDPDVHSPPPPPPPPHISVHVNRLDDVDGEVPPPISTDGKLLSAQEVPSRVDCVVIGTRLLETGYIMHVTRRQHRFKDSPKVLYKFNPSILEFTQIRSHLEDGRSRLRTLESDSARNSPKGKPPVETSRTSAQQEFKSDPQSTVPREEVDWYARYEVYLPVAQDSGMRRRKTELSGMLSPPLPRPRALPETKSEGRKRGKVGSFLSAVMHPIRTVRSYRRRKRRQASARSGDDGMDGRPSPPADAATSSPRFPRLEAAPRPSEREDSTEVSDSTIDDTTDSEAVRELAPVDDRAAAGVGVEAGADTAESSKLTSAGQWSRYVRPALMLGVLVCLVASLAVGLLQEFGGSVWAVCLHCQNQLCGVLVHSSGAVLTAEGSSLCQYVLDDKPSTWAHPTSSVAIGLLYALVTGSALLCYRYVALPLLGLVWQQEAIAGVPVLHGALPSFLISLVFRVLRTASAIFGLVGQVVVLVCDALAWLVCWPVWVVSGVGGQEARLGTVWRDFWRVETASNWFFDLACGHIDATHASKHELSSLETTAVQGSRGCESLLHAFTRSYGGSLVDLALCLAVAGLLVWQVRGRQWFAQVEEAQTHTPAVQAGSHDSSPQPTRRAPATPERALNAAPDPQEPVAPSPHPSVPLFRTGSSDQRTPLSDEKQGPGERKDPSGETGSLVQESARSPQELYGEDYDAKAAKNPLFYLMAAETPYPPVPFNGPAAPKIWKNQQYGVVELPRSGRVPARSRFFMEDHTVAAGWGSVVQSPLKYPLTVYDVMARRILHFNTARPVSFENDLIRGNIMMRLKSAPVCPNTKAYFTALPRMYFEIAAQIQFKRATRGSLWLGLELVGNPQVSFFSRTLIKMALKLISACTVYSTHYSFGGTSCDKVRKEAREARLKAKKSSGWFGGGGDAKEAEQDDPYNEGDRDRLWGSMEADQEVAHICFPVAQSCDKLQVTPPGCVAPELWTFSQRESVNINRKKSKPSMQFVPGNTYTLCFHSPNIDFLLWTIVQVTGLNNTLLSRFWGKEGIARVVAYELNPYPHTVPHGRAPLPSQAPNPKVYPADEYKLPPVPPPRTPEQRVLGYDDTVDVTEAQPQLTHLAGSRKGWGKLLNPKVHAQEYKTYFLNIEFRLDQSKIAPKGKDVGYEGAVYSRKVTAVPRDDVKVDDEKRVGR